MSSMVGEVFPFSFHQANSAFSLGLPPKPAPKIPLASGQTDEIPVDLPPLSLKAFRFPVGSGVVGGADFALKLPTTALARSVISYDRSNDPDLKSVKNLGNQALTGCIARNSQGCTTEGTIARLGRDIVAVDCDPPTEANTVTLARKAVNELKSGKT